MQKSASGTGNDLVISDGDLAGDLVFMDGVESGFSQRTWW